MRLLADENVPGLAVGRLQAQGHDVAWVRVDAPGASDEDVVAMATLQERVLVTVDKDFGQLAFKAGLSPPPGVVLFRLSPAPVADQVRRMVTALESRADWAGVMAVVDDHSIRARPLPR
jgi:predicted nuclease of predicted toxin-antitoxin system